jgi:hypothetical protein
VCRPGDRVPQDFQHLDGACRAGGNERSVGRVQQVPADLLGVCRSLRGKAIALVVGVPTQLHVPHERVLPRCGVVMLVLARTTHARACAADCVVTRPDDEPTGKMPGFTHRDQTSAEEARVVPLFGADGGSIPIRVKAMQIREFCAHESVGIGNVLPRGLPGPLLAAGAERTCQRGRLRRGMACVGVLGLGAHHLLACWTIPG